MTFNEFKSFLAEYGSLILKGLNGSFGKGIQIVDASLLETDNWQEKLAKDYPKGFVAEELIRQADVLAQLHPQSVNTLRIHTICYDGQVEVFHPYIRVGRGSSVVDNAGSGGVFSSCDPETGEILTMADETGNTYTNHPDNGFRLVGFRVPKWEEAFAMARQLALHDPSIHYAGWDLALTDAGWVLVEGNPRAQLVFQISEQKGFRPELEAILKKFNLQYNPS